MSEPDTIAADPGISSPTAPSTSALPRSGVFSLFRRDRRGVAAIEFAFLALPFFLLIFATIETGIVFLAELTLDQAVDQIGRTVRTGEVQKAAMTKEAFRKKLCAKVDFLLKCDGLIIDLGTYTTYASIPPPLKNGALNTTGSGYSPGAGDTISALRVFYRWQVHTDMMRKYLSDSPDGTHLLYAVSAFKTEPF